MDELKNEQLVDQGSGQTSSVAISQCGNGVDSSSVTINQCTNHTEGSSEAGSGDKPVKHPRKKSGAKTRRRQKGTGGLQLEKSGMYTVRCLINGKRVSKSTGTKDKDEAEQFLKKFLAPYVKDDPEQTYDNIQAAVMTEKQLAKIRAARGPQMKLADAWTEYVKSPMRRDLAQTTLDGKKQVFADFMKFMKKTFPEVLEVRKVTREHTETYLNIIRPDCSSTTYNNRLCVLREMYRVLMKKAMAEENPWEGYRLRPDDSHTRRELTVEELARLVDMASREGFEWRFLFAIAMYTGLRLGDCCKLTWSEVDIVRSIIQKIPEKTKKYRKGRPITVPIHKVLSDLLLQTPVDKRTGYVLPQIGAWATMGHAGMGRIHHRIGKIFHNAGIVTAVKVEGRKHKAPEAGFHSLRHTFVSLSANAGVPLHIIQSIVGHESKAMTLHYFHESLPALQQAVEAIPSISETGEVEQGEVALPDANRMYNRLPVASQPQLPPPAAILPAPVPQVAPEAPVEAAQGVSEDGIARTPTDAEKPLEGRNAARNAMRREKKLADVETANAAAANMGGWGLDNEKASHLKTVNNARKQEWISRCIRKWCVRSKVALLHGSTKLIGLGGWSFLSELWDMGVPMLPDEAVEKLEVFLRAKGVRGQIKSYLK